MPQRNRFYRPPPTAAQIREWQARQQQARQQQGGGSPGTVGKVVGTGTAIGSQWAGRQIPKQVTDWATGSDTAWDLPDWMIEGRLPSFDFTQAEIQEYGKDAIGDLIDKKAGFPVSDWLEKAYNSYFGGGDLAASAAENLGYNADAGQALAELWNAGGDTATAAFDAAGGFNMDALMNDYSGIGEAALAAEGAASGAEVAGNASEAAGGSSIGDYGAYLGAAMAVWKAYNALSNEDMTSDQRAQETAKAAALAVAGYFTAGIVPAAYAAASYSGEFQETEETLNRYDPSFQLIGSSGTIAGDAMGSSQGAKSEDYLNTLSGGALSVMDDVLGTSVLGSGKSTKEYQQERWGEVMGYNKEWKKGLKDQGLTDQEIEDMSIDEKAEYQFAQPEWAKARARGKAATKSLEGKRYNNVNRYDKYTDPTGKYEGEKWSWDKSRDIMETTNNYDGLIGVLGHAQEFGDKWHSLPTEKRREFIKKAYDQDLYGANEGSIYFSGKKGDKAKAQALMNEVVGGDYSQMSEEEVAGLQSPEFRYGYGDEQLKERIELGLSTSEVASQEQMDEAIMKRDDPEAYAQLMEGRNHEFRVDESIDDLLNVRVRPGEPGFTKDWIDTRKELHDLKDADIATKEIKMNDIRNKMMMYPPGSPQLQAIMANSNLWESVGGAMGVSAEQAAQSAQHWGGAPQQLPQVTYPTPGISQEQFKDSPWWGAWPKPDAGGGSNIDPGFFAPAMPSLTNPGQPWMPKPGQPIDPGRYPGQASPINTGKPIGPTPAFPKPGSPGMAPDYMNRGPVANAAAPRYGADVANKVAAAIAAGGNPGSGGPGYDWSDEKKGFVRR